MTVFFWLCWAFDLLAAAVLVWAVGFRSGFGASTGLQQVLLLLVAAVVIAGPLLSLSAAAYLGWMPGPSTSSAARTD